MGRIWKSTIDRPFKNCVSISPDMTKVAVAGRKYSGYNNLYIYGVTNGTPLKQYGLGDANGDYYSVDWSPDSKNIVCGGNVGTSGYIKIINPDDGNEVINLESGTTEDIYGVRWSSTNIIAAIHGSTVKFYAPYDNNGPDININHPLSGITTKFDTVHFKANISDLTGIKAAEFSINSNPYQPLTLDDNGYCLVVMQLDQIQNEIKVKVIDRVGNISEKTLIVKKNTGYLEIDKNSISLENASGSSDIIALTTNQSWTVLFTNNIDWLEITPSSGTGNQNITLKALKTNPLIANRSTNILISGGELTKIITVNQEGQCNLSVSTEKISVTAQITNSEFKIASNTEWIIKDDADWITTSPENGINDGNISLSILPNQTSNTREGAIKINGCNSTKTIIVIQEPANGLNGAPVANAGSDQTFYENDIVTLDGSASTDPENDVLTYKWTPPTEIILSSETDEKPTFTAPDVTIDTEFKFSLIVNDGTVDSPADEMIVTVQNINLNEGLAAYYPFNGNANDESGNGHNGTISGAMLSVDRNNIPNSSFYFDGSNDYILVKPAVLNSNTSYTTSVWIKAESVLPNKALAIMWERAENAMDNCGKFSAGNWAIEIYLEKLSHDIASVDNAGVCKWDRISYDNTISIGKWYFISSVYNKSDGTYKLYIDGELINSTAVNSNLRTWNGAVMNIGRNSSAAIQPWHGNIDDIRIYNRALSDKEVELLYKLGTNRPPVANAGTDQIVNEEDLVVLDGSSSTDPDKNTLTYKWTTPEGITLSSASDAKPTFTAPVVTIDTEFKFSLIVNDGTIDSPADEVIVIVKNNNDCLQHFHTVLEGTLGQEHMNLNLIGAKINGLDLEAGDEIGVFDYDLCVGYGKLSKTIDKDNILKIKVSKNDGTENGFTSGHEIIYKIWDCSEGIEIGVNGTKCFNNQLVSVTCLPFEPGATAYVELSAMDEICQELQFKTGWNIFSVPGLPKTPKAETIFQPFIVNNSLVKIQDEAGNSLENWGIFGGWVDNIENISPSEGYKIKVSKNDVVQVCGKPVEYPYSIKLNNGWNIIGYPQTKIFDAGEVVKQLIDRKTLIKVQDEAGNSIEDWGIFGGWQNNIINFVPGKGYKIKVNSNENLLIYDSYPKSSSVLPEKIATAHFLPGFEGNGVDHMNITLVSLPVNMFKAGEELAIFDGPTCVGAVTIMPHHLKNQAVSIAASASDNQGVKGFEEGNRFTLKLWNSQNNQEYILEPEIVKGISTFTKHETTVASLEKYATTGLEGLSGSSSFEINCNPNPFGNYIMIENHEKVTRLKITNVLGQTVIDSENPEHLINTEKLTDGVYFITLFGKDDVLKSVKMIKNSR